MVLCGIARAHLAGVDPGARRESDTPGAIELPIEGLELFANTSWVAVFLGQNIVPETYEPAADALDEDKVAAALEQMRLAILQTAERLPTQAEFIARTCAARDAAAPPPLPEFVFLGRTRSARW